MSREGEDNMDELGADLMAESVRLSDECLTSEVRFLAERARHNEIQLLTRLAVFDSRRLCVESGFRSLYEYCTTSLGFDEAEAHRRIRAARVVHAYPQALTALERRRVSLSSLVVLSPWLERDNVDAWLNAAQGKSRRELETLVAARYPQAPMPDSVRKCPGTVMIVGAAPPQALEASSSSCALEWGWQSLVPVSADRVRVGFDAALIVSRLIDRVRQLLRHKYPQGRLEDVIREVLEAYLNRKDPQRRLELKEGKTEASGEGPPRRRGLDRYIPARVKSAVWRRDDGRCSWRESDGRVCGSKDWLEYDHIRPYSRGGKSDDPRNVRLLCRAHNQAAARAAGLTVGPRSCE